METTGKKAPPPTGMGGGQWLPLSKTPEYKELLEREKVRWERIFDDKERRPVLVVGGSDGSGTRGVMDILLRLRVDVVFEDKGTMDVHGAEMFNGLGWPELVRLVLNGTGGSADYDTAPTVTARTATSDGDGGSAAVPVLDVAAQEAASVQLGRLFRAFRNKYLTMKRQKLDTQLTKQRKEQMARLKKASAPTTTTTTGVAPAQPKYPRVPPVPSGTKGGTTKAGPPTRQSGSGAPHRRLLGWWPSLSFSSSTTTTTAAAGHPRLALVVPPEADKVSFAFKAPVTMLLLPILAKVWTGAAAAPIVPPPTTVTTSNATTQGQQRRPNGGGRLFKFLHVVRE